MAREHGNSEQQRGHLRLTRWAYALLFRLLRHMIFIKHGTSVLNGIVIPWSGPWRKSSELLLYPLCLFVRLVAQFRTRARKVQKGSQRDTGGTRLLSFCSEQGVRCTGCQGPQPSWSQAANSSVLSKEFRSKHKLRSESVLGGVAQSHYRLQGSHPTAPS